MAPSSSPCGWSPPTSPDRNVARPICSAQPTEPLTRRSRESRRGLHECASNAVCMGILPEVFEVRDDGYLYVFNEHPPEDPRAKLREAVNGCPTGAISIRGRLTHHRAPRSPRRPYGCAVVPMTDLAPPSGPLRPVADRVLPRGQRALGAVQLALSRAASGGRSYCASRTPTRRAIAPNGPTGSSRRWTGSGMPPDEGPYFQSAQGEAHAAAIEALWASGALYACACTRGRLTSGRGKRGRRRPHAGIRRALPRPRAAPGGGEGAALPDARRGFRAGGRPGAGRGGVPRNAPSRTSSPCEGNGKPLFVLAERGRRSHHGDHARDPRRGSLLPSTPRQIMLWAALNAADGPDLALPAYAHLPLLVNERGKKLSKRRDPVAVEMYREQGYLPVGLPQLPGALGLEPRRRGDRAARGDHRALPARGRAALAGLLRHEEALARQRRLHPRPVRATTSWPAARPWVDPVPGEWAPGAWRDPDTGALAVEPRPGRPSASTPRSSPRWPR